MLPQTPGGNRIARRAAESFFRYHRLFWIAVIGITSIVTTALYLRGNTFVATTSTQVVPEQEVASALGFAKTSWVTPAQQNVSRFNDLLRDDEPGGFLDTALQNAHLQNPIRVDPRARDPRLAALRSKLSLQVDSDDVFTLYLTWDNPLECERILRALRDGYIEEAGTARQTSSVATATFLDTQIDTYQARMRVAEQALIDYKQKNSGQLPEAQTAEIEQMSMLKQERDYLKISSNDAALQQQAIEARLAKIQPTAILKQTVDSAPQSDSPAVLGLRDLETRRTTLLAEGWLPSGSRIQEIDAKIASMRERASKEVAEAKQVQAKNSSNKNIVQTTTQDNPEYRALMEQLTQAKIDQTTNTARLGLLNNEIAQYEKRIKALPLAARILTDKTRDYSILKTQYEDLLTRREQARIKASLDKVAATSTLHPIGSVYAVPTFGNKKLAIVGVGSLLFSILVGLGLVIFAEWQDPTFRYNTDIERLLGVPVITGLPLIAAPPKSIAGKGIPLVGAMQPDSA